MKKNEDVNLIEFYQNLRKKEKTQFLNYLLTTYGFCPSTIMQKVRKHNPLPFKIVEEKIIKEIISNEKWR